MAFTAASTASLLSVHSRQPYLLSLPSTRKPIVAKSTAHERWIACQSVGGVKARFGSSKSGTGLLDRPAFDQSQLDPFTQVQEGGDIGRSKVRKGPGSGDSYRVLLVDDVHHTEKMVAKALPLAVPSVNPDDARKLFHASRENGVATVIITVKEHAEFYTQMMLRKGLRSRMEPDSNIA